MDPSDTVMGHTKMGDGSMTTLNNTIEVINIAKDLVPLELGKGVLSAFAGILTIIRVCCLLSSPMAIKIERTTSQDTIKNKDDFADVISQCHRISFILWRATSDTPEHEMSDLTHRALVDLQMYVCTFRVLLVAQALNTQICEWDTTRTQVPSKSRDQFSSLPRRS
jgi:hypothetical protein